MYCIFGSSSVLEQLVSYFRGIPNEFRAAVFEMFFLPSLPLSLFCGQIKTEQLAAAGRLMIYFRSLSCSGKHVPHFSFSSDFFNS
jgi:hypothetical protein